MDDSIELTDSTECCPSRHRVASHYHVSIPCLNIYLYTLYRVQASPDYRVWLFRMSPDGPEQWYAIQLMGKPPGQLVLGSSIQAKHPLSRCQCIHSPELVLSVVAPAHISPAGRPTRPRGPNAEPCGEHVSNVCGVWGASYQRVEVIWSAPAATTTL